MEIEGKEWECVGLREEREAMRACDSYDNNDDDGNDTEKPNDDTNRKKAHVLRRDVEASKHTYLQRTFHLIYY